MLGSRSLSAQGNGISLLRRENKANPIGVMWVAFQNIGSRLNESWLNELAAHLVAWWKCGVQPLAGASEGADAAQIHRLQVDPKQNSEPKAM